MTTELVPLPLSPDDLELLRVAKRKLESPSFAIEVVDLIGVPLEAGMKFLPKRYGGTLTRLTEAALVRAVNLAIGSLGTSTPQQPSRDRLHRWLSVGSGAAGGVFGMWSLAVELPLSITIMLRAIADIARAEGHDLTQVETRLACLEVFALGGKKPEDDALDTSYWVIRASLGKALADAAAYISERGLVAEGSPALVRLASAIAGRLSVEISAEAAAKAIPFVSAATGAAINLLFIQHYQEIARGHFIVKRLEATYGTETVRTAYARLAV